MLVLSQTNIVALCLLTWDLCELVCCYQFQTPSFSCDDYHSAYSVEKQHATITRGEKNEVYITPASANARTKVNGQPLTSKKQLVDLDRVLFGMT